MAWPTCETNLFQLAEPHCSPPDLEFAAPAIFVHTAVATANYVSPGHAAAPQPVSGSILAVNNQPRLCPKLDRQPLNQILRLQAPQPADSLATNQVEPRLPHLLRKRFARHAADLGFSSPPSDDRQWMELIRTKRRGCHADQQEIRDRRRPGHEALHTAGLVSSLIGLAFSSPHGMAHTLAVQPTPGAYARAAEASRLLCQAAR